MKASANALNIIRFYESCKQKAYKCPSGVLTIGYGHTGNDVKENQVIGITTANFYLEQDIIEFEDQINALNLSLNQNQFDAVISIVFNIGIGNFKNSTLFEYIEKSPNDARICQAFCMWIKAGEMYIKGLARRRLAEATLYFT